DPLDLAAVFEVACDLGSRVVQGLALQQLFQPGPGLAALLRLFLAGALGRDALLLFLLRAQCPGLAQVHLRAGLARRSLRRSLAPPALALAAARLLACTCGRTTLASLSALAARTARMRGLACGVCTLGRGRPGCGFRRLEAEVEQLVAKAVD